jgi:hypothetical protein
MGIITNLQYRPYRNINFPFAGLFNSRAELAMAARQRTEGVRDILESRNRLSCYDTAPASGLFLVKVFYDEKSVNGFKLEKPPFWT